MSLDSLGTPQRTVDETLVLPWNDWDNTARLIRQHGRELATVIVEPILGGYIAPEPEFLQRLRSLTVEYGILLVFDEIKTGFRVALGGAQQRFGVRPDLTALGKILGGGLPIGAVLGRADVVDLARPGRAGQALFHSGTFNGHPTVMAAGLAVISELEKPGTYEALNQLADDFRDRIRAACRRRRVAVTTPGVGPVVGLVLADREPRDYRDVARSDVARRRELDLRLLADGVFLRPQDRFNLSVAHSPQDIAAVAKSVDEALAAL